MNRWDIVLIGFFTASLYGQETSESTSSGLLGLVQKEGVLTSEPVLPVSDVAPIEKEMSQQSPAVVGALPLVIKPIPQTVAAPQAPAAPAQKQESEVSQVPTSSTPINEVVPLNLPAGWQEDQRPGNYQKKSQIFTQAGKIYDEIRKVEPSIQQARDTFFGQRSKLNQTMYTFFYDIGASQNELLASINSLLAEIAAESTKEGQTTDAERTIVQEINQNKSDLDQLKLNLSALEALGGALDTALVQLDSILSTIQTYEDQGWDLYQKIDELFDDVQATNLLGQLSTLQENAVSLQTYVQTTFAQFFATTSTTVTTQMTQIKSAVQTLKDRGVALAQQEDDLDVQEEARRKAAQEAEKKPVELKAPENTGLVSYITSMWNNFVLMFQSLYCRFFGAYSGSLPAEKNVVPSSGLATGVKPVSAVTQPTAASQASSARAGSGIQSLPQVTLPAVAQTPVMPSLPAMKK